MAAILRSSVIQKARPAFSGEGFLSVRSIRTSRKVGPSFRKVDDVARKEELVDGFKKRLVRELNSGTPSLLGKAIQCMIAMSAVGAYMLGQQARQAWRP